MQRSTLWVFFLSGLAALIYMAGLGVGHLAGGHLADRSSRRTSLLLFAIAEEQRRYAPACDRETLTDFNTDLFPKDGFNRPAAAWHPPRTPGSE